MSPSIGIVCDVSFISVTLDPAGARTVVATPAAKWLY